IPPPALCVIAPSLTASKICSILLPTIGATKQLLRVSFSPIPALLMVRPAGKKYPSFIILKNLSAHLGAFQSPSADATKSATRHSWSSYDSPFFWYLSFQIDSYTSFTNNNHLPPLFKIIHIKAICR